MEKHHFNTALIVLAVASASAVGARAGGLLDLEFGDADFNKWVGVGADPYIIDNPYWPLRPDDSPRTFTYISAGEDECVVDQLTVTGNIHTLGGDAPYTGFDAVEVEDVEYVFEEVEEEDCHLGEDGVDLVNSAVKEATRDWYAQDDQGNIWYLGEISRVYGVDEDMNCGDYGGTPPLPGEFNPTDVCFEGSWEAGKGYWEEPYEPPEGEEDVVGEAGIVVPGDQPVEGEPLTPGTYYMQEVAYEAEDMAKILKLNASVSVDEGDFATAEYDNCRKVKEWTALDPGASVEHKWYCPDPGPGLILIEGVGGGPTEAEVLVNVDPELD